MGMDLCVMILASLVVMVLCSTSTEPKEEILPLFLMMTSKSMLTSLVLDRKEGLVTTHMGASTCCHV